MQTLTPNFEQVALTALRHFGDDNVFEIAIANRKECEKVAVTFEKMGCVVVRSSEKHLLTVIPPVIVD